MDATIDLRKRIHDFIEIADERILRVFNAIITTEEELSVPESFYEELDHRRAKHLEEKSKSYTWQEVKERAKTSVK